MALTKRSVYLAYLLRHDPESIGLTMDVHGWVDVEELLDKINGAGKYTMTRELLDRIVREDTKGRYRFSPDGSRIKACQGHSISWIQPELTVQPPPEYLYHGTTREAYEKIRSTGGICRMGRHAVHMQAEETKSWQSAKRWRKEPVVLKIHAGKMQEDGIVFGVSDNGIWCAEAVPVKYIAQVLCLSDEQEETQ